MKALNERGVEKICDFQPIRCWLSETGRPSGEYYKTL